MTIADRTGARGMDGTLRRLFAGGTLAGLSDGDLLERFATRRDEDAFEALVRRHGPMVWAACRGVLRDDHDAEDAFQATFLVLARRAPALWASGRSLGGWLHTVAHRAAARLIADAARRRARERRAAGPEAATPPEPADDLRAAIHREVARLPARLREPVVLCELGDRTHAQAASELGRGEATVRRRLAEARGLLRDRLQRQGIAPAAAGIALLRAARAEAAVPEALTAAAVRSAVGLASGLASRSAAAVLGLQVIRRMFLARAAVAAAALSIAVAAVAALAFAMGPRTGRDSDDGPPPGVSISARPPAAAAAPRVVAPQGDPTDPVPVAGIVLDADGRPVPGATVVFRVPDELPFPDAGRVLMAWEARSGPDGRFRVETPPWRAGDGRPGAMGPRAFLAAFAEGFGVAGQSGFAPEDAGDLTLRLARDDAPIEGRILDLEGRPIAGVRVSASGLYAPADGDLDPYLARLPEIRDNSDDAWAGLDALLPLLPFDAHAPAATTDADGRFRLLGLGRDRVVALDLRGPTIAAHSGTYIYARTRPGLTYRFPMHRGDPEYGAFLIYGASFEHVAMPTRPIEGTVRDAETGAPIPGVAIVSERFAGNLLPGRHDLRTVTDAEGRYRLVGMPPGEGNAIRARPGPGRPYFGLEVEVPGGTAAEPAVVDFALRRGVLIRGRVTNAETGRTVSARVEYFAFADNPHLEGARGFASEPVDSGEDGAFAIVGLPGRGLIAVQDERDRFAVAQGIDAIDGLQGRGGLDGVFITEPLICQPRFYHTIVEVDPAADAEEAIRDVVLVPGRRVSGTVVGPDGEPIAEGVEVSGLRAWTMVWDHGSGTLDSAEFTLEALDPGRPRRVTFRHAGRDLIASLVVRGDEPGPLVVRLETAAVATGRLVDDRGRPASRVTINVAEDESGALLSWARRFAEAEVGDDGAFRVSGLVPGLAYDLDALDGRRLSGEVARGLVLEPGESRDLGEVAVGAPGDRALPGPES